MTIREAGLSDAAPMAWVMVHTFLVAHRGQVPESVWGWRRTHWTPEVSAQGWERILRGIADGTRPGDGVYVAEDAPGRIVGLAMGEPARGGSGTGDATGEVTVMYVHPDHQGRGIGRRLLRAVAAHLAARGATALQIGTLTTNTPARRFYEALGGRVTAERQIEDGGHPLTEVVYGWPDIGTLIPAEVIWSPNPPALLTVPRPRGSMSAQPGSFDA